MIRVMTVDDHPVLRDGIAALLENQPDMSLVGEASNGQEAVELYRKVHPDVTLMDLQMPGMDGITAIRAIRSEYPAARMIVLTTYEGDVQAVRAIKAGAAGYLLKSALRKELLDTIRAIHAGRRYILPEIAQDIALHAADDDLSERELAVLRLVAQGNANKRIAWELSISEETVKAHLKSIFSKLAVGDRTHAVMVAMKRGALQI